MDLTWAEAVLDGFSPELEPLGLEALLRPAGPGGADPADEVGVAEREQVRVLQPGGLHDADALGGDPIALKTT